MRDEINIKEKSRGDIWNISGQKEATRYQRYRVALVRLVRSMRVGEPHV